MKIHFVCSGNTNRSRMAEAYMNSKQIPGVTATSSGIHADDNLNGDICWYTKIILDEADLWQYTFPTWTKTTSELLAANDLIIFMQEEHSNFVQRKLRYIPPQFEIWNVSDVIGAGFFQTARSKARMLQKDREIFEKIKEKVNSLADRLA